ncbi:MAG: hypothetical protein UT32_C0026G0009 [Parcubacteria group bacterium GW2011_GWC2_39_14]|nr:MAG: hypothetical protein UT32_C0026G0009 [Parcubacteria group bacterium GW2011_GWC2_39_14]KKR53431.1 MAG: hypothetical protein UT91_C0027G0009 [Parcubacteria group bacterium GW2011_GWA2_40_23]
MRTLVFNGKFGYLKNNIFSGTVVFCHFEDTDSTKLLFKAAWKFVKMSSGTLILIPFTHLFEKCANKEQASQLFNKFTGECTRLKPSAVVVIPFGIEKEFILYAPAKDSAIKFMKF